MAEATNQDSDNSSPVESTEVKTTTTQKTFSQDEVDALIGKRLTRERAKTDEATRAAIAAAIAEHDKKARMTEEERFAEERKQRGVSKLSCVFNLADGRKTWRIYGGSYKSRL